MKKPKFGGSAAAFLAVAIGAVLAFAMPAGAAPSLQSESPPVEEEVTLANRAVLPAEGEAVVSFVFFVCTPGRSASVSVSMRQTIGGTVAAGAGTIQIPTCLGILQGFEVEVDPAVGSFVRGPVSAKAELTTCDAKSCATVVDQRTVFID